MIYALDLWDGSQAICESFRFETGITYPILMMAGSAGVGEDYDCIQTSFFVVDGEGYIRYRRTNAEGGMPAFIPEEVGPVVDQALAELATSSASVDMPQMPFRLEAAYPNPFNPQVNFPYSLSDGSGEARVILRILDLKGRIVETLFDGTRTRGHSYLATWNGRNAEGVSQASGVYLVELVVDGQAQARLISLVE